MKFYILLLSITCLSLTCSSQNTGDWEEVVRQWTDAENIESAALENVFESLSELSEQPINLNQADREELEQLPFLTAQQVEDILAYVHRYGIIRSYSELQMITSLDTERRQLLRFFVYMGEAKKRKNSLRIGRASGTDIPGLATSIPSDTG